MKIYVAGHRGMVGSAIVRHLKSLGQTRIITRTRKELDLLDQHSVRDFMQSEKPDQVCLAAAKVGGIHANNTYPAEFIHDNLVIETNVIQAARSGVHKLLFLGSSCIYPSHINVGTGLDYSIRELAQIIARVTGFTGHLIFDTTKPDGTPRKLLDVSKLKALGWIPSIPLEQGLAEVYEKSFKC